MTPRGKRIAKAVGAAIVLLACQLYPPFIENTYGPWVGAVTALALLAYGWRFGAFAVTPVVLGLVPSITIIAMWEVERAHHAFTGTSDLEDGLVMVSFGVLGPAGVALATWLDGCELTIPRFERLRALTGYVVLAIVATLTWNMIQRVHVWKIASGDAVVCALGVAGWIATRLAGRRVYAERDAILGSKSGQHRGDGWIELDEPAPVHHPSLVGRDPGPVLVFDLAPIEAGGYRDAKPRDFRVLEGNTDAHIGRIRRRAASWYLLGVAVMLAASFKILATGILSFREARHSTGPYGGEAVPYGAQPMR